MSEYKKSPNIPLPQILEYDSFLHKYKILLRKARSSFVDDPHYHAHIDMWYNVSGEYTMLLNDDFIRCTPGTLLFMPPFAVHAMDTRTVDMNSAEIICVSYPYDAFYKRPAPVYPLSFNSVVCGNNCIPLCIKFSGEEKKQLDVLFRTALSEYTKQRDMLRTRIYETIDRVIEICASHSNRTLSPTQLSAAIKRVNNINMLVEEVFINFKSPPLIEEAAKKCQVTPQGFTKLFKRTTNRTYHEFVTAIRVMKAVVLLKYTQKSIAEISAECGYVDSFIS